MSDYRNLDAWRLAHELTLAVYKATRSYPRHEQFGLSIQTRRAAASMPANLAEGAGRAADRDFARFVGIASGSANETEYHLLLAHDLGYIPDTEYRFLADQIVRIRSMLTRLRQALLASN